MLGRRRSTDPADRVPRKDRTGASAVKVGALTLLVIGVIVFFGFTKDIPFTHGYRLKAVVESANSIRVNSPVRIAGVNVGKVKSVERAGDSNASVVELEIDKKGLPIHKDATIKIRPRIFLEGNFFVDLQPGTPAAPKLSSGDTLPISQTAGPVQLDQVLTALQADTRRSLQDAVTGFGDALTRRPSEADDASADPSARGQSAAESLNDAIDYGAPALRNTAIITEALLGTEPHDLSRLLKGLARTTAGLSRNEASLQDLLTNFNATMAATASQATNLRTSIRLLGPTLQSADTTLDALNAAFPDTRAFAREILPGVRETAPTIAAAFPWIRQVRPLVSPAELGGLVNDLSPATRDLARLIDGTTELLPQANLVAKCLAQVVLPTGDVKIQDGNLTSGAENYKEFWYTMVALAGEGQNFDGNGQYVRFQPGGGTQTVALDAGDRLYGNAPVKPLGTRPRFPGKRPPYNSSKPCYQNPLPDVNGAAYGPPDTPVQTAGGGSGGLGGVTGALPGGLGGVLPTAGAAAARDRQGLADELASRLNPFRGAADGATAGAGG
ncbi:MAG TPA: MlaD family protein [Solirubrobacteraceae bacterium]|nr:MlaD family protein [Solirubrobacteraceae bacterium]